VNPAHAGARAGDPVRHTRSRQTAPALRGGRGTGRPAHSGRAQVDDWQMGLAVDVGEDQLHARVLARPQLAHSRGVLPSRLEPGPVMRRLGASVDLVGRGAVQALVGTGLVVPGGEAGQLARHGVSAIGVPTLLSSWAAAAGRRATRKSNAARRSCSASGAKTIFTYAVFPRRGGRRHQHQALVPDGEMQGPHQGQPLLRPGAWVRRRRRRPRTYPRAANAIPAGHLCRSNGARVT